VNRRHGKAPSNITDGVDASPPLRVSRFLFYTALCFFWAYFSRLGIYAVGT
jgi:hypothetical protein